MSKSVDQDKILESTAKFMLNVFSGSYDERFEEMLVSGGGGNSMFVNAWQKHCMSTDINCAKDMATQIINTAMFLFMKLNKIIVYICEEKYKPVDRTKEFKLSIDTLKNQIQEYENLFK